MQEIVLHSMTIKSFKGIKSLKIDFKNTTKIFGDNGTGKSTVFDAFCWLLFGKDSNGISKFEIRPLDKNNQPVRRGEHLVTAKINDHEISRVFREKWTKTRGEEEEHYDGNETIFTVNGAIYKAGEYSKFISDLVNEDVFKILTSVTQFASLPWAERRKILFSLITDQTDDEIAGADKDFLKLLDFLKDKQIEQVKKDIKSKIAIAKKEVAHLPSMIEEQERNIPEYCDFEAVKKERNSIYDPNLINVEIDAINAEIEFDIRNARANHEKKQNEEKKLVEIRADEITTAVVSLQKKNETLIKEEQKLVNLRAEYDTKFAETYSPTSCPTCKQMIKDYTEEKFKETKLQQLEEIKQKGIKQKEVVDVLKKEISEFKIPEPLTFTAVEFDDSELRKKIQSRKSVDEKVLERMRELDQIIGQETVINQIKERISELKAKNLDISKQLASLQRTEFQIDKWTKHKSDLSISKINSLFKFVQFKLYDFTNDGNPVEVCEILVDGVPYETNLNSASKINAGIEICNVLSEFYGIKCPVFLDNMESCTKPLTVNSQSIHLIVDEKYGKLEIC